jgi:peptidoglycan/LPS O-acetylase OafA/YrhL
MPVITMVTAVFIMVLAHAFLSGKPFPMGRAPFYFSASFLSDWVFSVGVALFIVSMDSMGIEFSDRVTKNLRVAGDFTFPVYLFHFPVIFFLTAVTGYRPETPFSAILFGLIILSIVLGLGFLSERFRPWWRESVKQLAFLLERNKRN